MALEFNLFRLFNLVAIIVAGVWAYFGVRLISVGRKGALEWSWRNSANGAVSIALGVLFGGVSETLNIDWAQPLGSGLIALGGVFMAWAMRNQFLVWKSVTSSSDSAKILDSFAKSTARLNSSGEKALSTSEAKSAKLRGLWGKRMILEFDPVTNYERYVASLIRESSECGSSTILFTKPGSALSGLGGTKLVHLSVSEQSLRLSPEGVLSVSITNPSLILDAFKSVVVSNPDATIIIDNLTDLTLTLGFEKTYNLLQQIGERMMKSNLFLVLLLNPGAHDVKINAAFEGYGNVIIRFDGTGMHSKKGGELLSYV